MASFDYALAYAILNASFTEASTHASPLVVSLLNRYQKAFDIVFESKTQSYREVLLGCALVHVISPVVNIRLPYVKQGVDAFNGRSLDEEVINPFLISRQVPCSKGPYLATFRRNVKLDASTRSGLRDQHGYDSMLSILKAIEASKEEEARALLICLLKKFIDLREKSVIQLASIARMSIEQYQHLLEILLHNQSGGRIPMLITEALFQTVNEQYCLNWEIKCQGINAADGATGVPGDIMIIRDSRIVKAIEVTERPINHTRVATTFSTKIALSDVKDYLFVYTSSLPEDGAYAVARNYFAQGYDINFIKLTNLVVSTFIAGDVATRTIFTNYMLALLGREDTPASVKTAWNDSLLATINT